MTPSRRDSVGRRKVLVVDIDSTIPNLAMMTASAAHKAQGDEVALYDHCPKGQNMRKAIPLDLIGWADLAYISCVFKWNAGTARAVGRALQATETIYGGQGLGVFSPTGEPLEFVRLPPDIAAFQHRPDYSIYPEDNYALGFCNRGCFRECKFCSVPRLEGKINPKGFVHPRDWVPDDRKAAHFLDNEFAAYPPKLQRDYLQWGHDAGVRICISQGIDLRIVGKNPALAQMFAEFRLWDKTFSDRRIYCAWDNFCDGPDVLRGVDALLDAGVSPADLTCYELIGWQSTRAEDLLRFAFLWHERKVRPFAMIFNKRRDDPWLNHFARYCNRYALRNLAWEDYEYAGFRARDHPAEAT